MPSKMWTAMNDVDAVTSKICSAREILDCAIDRLQEHQYDKVEQLMYAVDEFLQYYLAEFDEKFQLAWQETVVKQKEEEEDHCMPPWGHSDMEYLIKNKKDKVKRWVLPVEEVKIEETDEIEYFITFPDDLLEAANLNEGDQIEWVDNKDGTYTLRHVTMTNTLKKAGS